MGRRKEDGVGSERDSVSGDVVEEVQVGDHRAPPQWSIAG